LHLSQSTISYTVSRLQESLGIALLRIEGRKAVLTSEGRALLQRSRQVLKDAIALETYARHLGCGGAGEVRLTVDQNFPNDVLMRALRRFRERGADAAQVSLREMPLLQAEDILRDTSVDLVIGEQVPLGFLGEPLIEVEYLAVAHPEHPLLRLGREIGSGDLVQHTQIRTGPAEGADKLRVRDGARAPHWIMNSFDGVLAATLERLGYAWLPAHRIRPWLERGQLRTLPLNDRQSRKAMYYLVHGRAWAASPAIAQLAEALRWATAREQDARNQAD
jgi:DNA-binding transcriptional LysR family regulator